MQASEEAQKLGRSVPDHGCEKMNMQLESFTPMRDAASTAQDVQIL